MASSAEASLSVLLEIAAGRDHAMHKPTGDTAAIVRHVPGLMQPGDLAGRQGRQFCAVLRKRDAALTCCDLAKMKGKRAAVRVAAAGEEWTGRRASRTA